MKQMKRILLRSLLVVLVLAECILLSVFLPERWQENIDSRLQRVWPLPSCDYSRVTHPNLKDELRPLKPWVMAINSVAVVANGAAIVALWRRRNG
jgi:hypothetical protein